MSVVKTLESKFGKKLTNAVLRFGLGIVLASAAAGLTWALGNVGTLPVSPEVAAIVTSLLLAVQKALKDATGQS